MAESEDKDYEVVELEYTEDDIAYYIEDEDGNELGFAIVDENGNEVEYYYEGNGDDYVEVGDAPAKPATPKHQVTAGAKAVKEESLAYMAGNAAAKIRGKAAQAPDLIKQKSQEYKPAVSKEELKETATDLNAIYHDGKEVATELKSAYDEIAGIMDFIPHKKFHR